ncbi:hypothetical protein [Actinomadura soli]|uniref:hypothetical protein n=1 Tax=Actinomadura soli TaxID=2508997 RepID=UPI001486B688|nr:hypothetical protein [Actinomadura soli]
MSPTQWHSKAAPSSGEVAKVGSIIKFLFTEVSLSSRPGDKIRWRSMLHSPCHREMVVMADDAGRESPAESAAIQGGRNNGEHQHHRDR